MKKIFLLLSALLCISYASNAQENSNVKTIAKAIEMDLEARTAILNVSGTLQEKLVEKFGAEFNLNSESVVAYLLNVVKDADETQDNRRHAVNILYGKEGAMEHTEEINTKKYTEDEQAIIDQQRLEEEAKAKEKSSNKK